MEMKLNRCPPPPPPPKKKKNEKKEHILPALQSCEGFIDLWRVSDLIHGVLLLELGIPGKQKELNNFTCI